MAEEWLSREAALIGEEGIARLQAARVTVFGVGGVGSYTVEALARAGIGSLTLIDGDTVALSNLNRQLIADHTTLGRSKAEVAAERVAHIHPACEVRACSVFADAGNTASLLEESRPTFIVDAIDSVTTKLLIATWAVEHDVPLIASMGTGNKLDPSRLTITDLAKTSVCPLARVMRRELKSRGIYHLPVLFSTEEPVHTGMRTPASISFVPSTGGLLIAGYVVRRLLGLSH